MIIRPSVLAKIASGMCNVDEHGLIRHDTKPMLVNIKELLRHEIVWIDNYNFLRLTPRGMALLERRTSTSTLLYVLRSLRHRGSLFLVGDMTRPDKYRRQTIEQMENEGFVKVENAIVTITPLGEARLGFAYETLTFDVVPEHVAEVKRLVEPFLARNL